MCKCCGSLSLYYGAGRICQGIEGVTGGVVAEKTEILALTVDFACVVLWHGVTRLFLLTSIHNTVIKVDVAVHPNREYLMKRYDYIPIGYCTEPLVLTRAAIGLQVVSHSFCAGLKGLIAKHTTNHCESRHLPGWLRILHSFPTQSLFCRHRPVHRPAFSTNFHHPPSPWSLHCIPYRQKDAKAHPQTFRRPLQQCFISEIELLNVHFVSLWFYRIPHRLTTLRPLEVGRVEHIHDDSSASISDANGNGSLQYTNTQRTQVAVGRPVGVQGAREPQSHRVTGECLQQVGRLYKEGKVEANDEERRRQHCSSHMCLDCGASNWSVSPAVYFLAQYNIDQHVQASLRTSYLYLS